jgi:hypothetical protein
MRLLAVFLIAASSLLAQRAGGGARMGARPSGAGGRRLAAPPLLARPAYTGTVIAPYPVYYGGGYYAPYAGYYGYPYGYDPASAAAAGYGYDPNYAGDPNYAPNYPPNNGYDPNSQPPPGVIINRNYTPDSVTPVLHDYSNTPLPQPGPDYQPQTPYQSNAPQAAGIDGPQVIFLIAMKDHTIFPAVAYWVEGGDTLNYITTQGVHNRATLDLVDRDFSKLLNDQRHVDFALPPPPH